MRVTEAVKSREEYIKLFNETHKLRGIPREFITTDMCKEFIQNGGSFSCLPGEHRTEKMVDFYIEVHGSTEGLPRKYLERKPKKSVEKNNRSTVVVENKEFMEYLKAAQNGNLKGTPDEFISRRMVSVAKRYAREHKDYSGIPGKFLNPREAFARYKLTGDATGLADNVKDIVYKRIIAITASLDDIPEEDRTEELKAYCAPFAEEKRKALEEKDRIEKIKAEAAAMREEKIGKAKAKARARLEQIKFSKTPVNKLTVEEAIERYEATGKIYGLAEEVKDPVYKYVIKKTFALNGIPQKDRTPELREFKKVVRESASKEEKEAIRNQRLQKNTMQSDEATNKRLASVIATGNLKDIPAHLRTKAMIDAAHKWAKEHNDYSGIPSHLLTPEEALAHYKNTGISKNLSEEAGKVVYEYIAKTTGSLKGIPQSKRPPKLKNIAKKARKAKTIKKHKEQKKQKEKLQRVVTKSGKIIHYPVKYVTNTGKLKVFKPEDITPGMVKAGNKWAIDHKNYTHLPKEYMSLEAAINYVMATRKLDKVPEQYKEQVYTKHLDLGGKLSDIPVKERTVELCIQYIKLNGNLAGVPKEHLKNSPISIYEALHEATGNINNVPAQYRTKSMARRESKAKNFGFTPLVRVDEHITYEAAERRFNETDSLVGIPERFQQRIAFKRINLLLREGKGIIEFAHGCGLNAIEFRALFSTINTRNGFNKKYHERINADLEVIDSENNAIYLPLAEDFNNITTSVNYSTKALNIEQKVRFTILLNAILNKKTYRRIASNDIIGDVYKYLHLIGKQEEYGSFIGFCDLKLGLREQSETIIEKKPRGSKKENHREWLEEFDAKKYLKDEKHTFPGADGKNIVITEEIINNILSGLRLKKIPPISCIMQESIRLYTLGKFLDFLKQLKNTESSFKQGTLEPLKVSGVRRTIAKRKLVHGIDIDSLDRLSQEEIDGIEFDQRSQTKLALAVHRNGNLKSVKVHNRTPLIVEAAHRYAREHDNYKGIPVPLLEPDEAYKIWEQTGEVSKQLRREVKVEVFKKIIETTKNPNLVPSAFKMPELNELLKELGYEGKKSKSTNMPSAKKKRAKKEEKVVKDKKTRVKKSAEDKAQAKITKYQDFIERADYNGIPNRAKGDKTLLPLILARAAEIGDYSRIPVKYLDPATIEKLKEAKKPKGTDGTKKKRTTKAAKTKKGSVSPEDIKIIEVSDDKINPDDIEIIEVSDDKINPDDIKIIDSGSEKAEENTGINTDIVFANDVPENIKKLLFNSLSPFERKFICLIYGLETGVKSTIKQAGESLGMNTDNAYNTRRIIVAKHPKLIREILDFTKQRKKDINAEVRPDKSIILIGNVPEEIRKLILRIPKSRHREIICLHYGLKDGKKYTLVEISNMLGISSEHVQKTLAELAIKHKALMAKIREFANVSEETAPAVTRVKEVEREQIDLNTYNGCATYIEQTGRLIDIPSEFQSDEGLIKLARIYALRNNNYSGIRKEHMNYLMCINYINKFHSLDMVPEEHRILQLMLYYADCSGNFDCDPEWHENGEIRAIYYIVRDRTDFMRKLGNPNIRVELSDFPTSSREKAAAYFAKDEAHNALPTSSARAQISKLEDAKAKLGIIAEKANTSANNIQSVVSNGDGENEQAPKNPMKTIEKPN